MVWGLWGGKQLIQSLSYEHPRQFSNRKLAGVMYLLFSQNARNDHKG